MIARRLWKAVHEGHHYVLDLPSIPTLRVYKRAADLRWYWYVDGLGTLPHDDQPGADAEACMVAAEGAARSILLAGLRLLDGDAK